MSKKYLQKSLKLQNNKCRHLKLITACSIDYIDPIQQWVASGVYVQNPQHAMGSFRLLSL